MQRAATTLSRATPRVKQLHDQLRVNVSKVRCSSPSTITLQKMTMYGSSRGLFTCMDLVALNPRSSISRAATAKSGLPDIQRQWQRSSSIHTTSICQGLYSKRKGYTPHPHHADQQEHLGPDAAHLMPRTTKAMIVFLALGAVVPLTYYYVMKPLWI